MIARDSTLRCLVFILVCSFRLTLGHYKAAEKRTLLKRVIEPPEFSDCPHGYTRFADSCYIAAHDIANWPDSMVYCKAYAAHLAFVESADEQNFLAGFLKNASGTITDPDRYFWIGGTDAVSEGEWIWSTVYRPVTYTNWTPGEPNNNEAHESKHQDCMAMYAATGLWDDGWCETKHNFVCELDLYESVGPAVIG